MEKEEDYIRLKSEYNKVKRRLEKRETMIEIALSKLEVCLAGWIWWSGNVWGV